MLVARWFENRGDAPADLTLPRRNRSWPRSGVVAPLPEDAAVTPSSNPRPPMTPRHLGARGRRFVLELPLDSPDGFGGVVRTYAAGPQLWGAIEMLRGEERAAPTGPSRRSRIA